MASERRARWGATTDQQERVTLEREMSELRDYADMLANDEAKFDVADISQAVDSYKAEGKDPDLKARAQLDIKANSYFAKYVAEIVAKATPNKPDTASSEIAEEPLDREEQLEKVLDEEMQKVYDDPDELHREAVDTRASFFTERLQKMRERFEANPSVENEKHLKLFENKARGFTRLLEFVEQWQNKKLKGETTEDFALYMARLHSAAEAEVMKSIETGGGHRGQLTPERTEYVNRVEAAYQAGWSTDNNSLNSRIRRRVVPVVRGRVNNNE